jgi:hypothetical protein
MDDILVNGVSMMALVFGLVEFIKKFKVSGNWLILASAGIGLCLGVGFQIAQMYPEFSKWFGVAVYGILVGLAASGAYDFINKRSAAG